MNKTSKKPLWWPWNLWSSAVILDALYSLHLLQYFSFLSIYLIYFPKFSTLQLCFLIICTHYKATYLCSHVYLTLYIEAHSLNLVTHICDNSFHLQVVSAQSKLSLCFAFKLFPTCTYTIVPLFLLLWVAAGQDSFRSTLQFSFAPYKHRQTLSTFSLLICITILPRNPSLAHLTVTRIIKLSLITQGWQKNTKPLQTNHKDSTADYYYAQSS